MVANRNQHFVPQMYLKLFNGGDERRIDILPMRTGQVVRDASLRDQASSNWFYDKDGNTERRLSVIEGAAAAIIKEMLARDRPPVRLSSAHQGLAMFVALQHSRTKAAADEANERADKVAKSMFSEAHPGHEILSRLDLVRVTLTEPVAEAMRASFLGTPMLYDLRMKLIVNASGRPFIASDAPVVMHNRLYEGTGAPAQGYGNSGLQILLPLGPWRALLMYDEDSYAVGSSASMAVRLVNPRHADLVNDLQWESANAVMFVPREADEQVLLAGWARWRGRVSDRVLVEQTVLEENETSKRTRLGVGSIPSRVGLDLPFVRITAPPPPPWTGEAHPDLRHPEWVDRVSFLAGEVEAGRLDYGKFVTLTLKVPRTARKGRR